MPSRALDQSFLPVATFRSGRVPRVDEVSPYGVVGVTRSKELAGDPNPPYVARDVDHLVDEVLAQRGVALVTGAYKAGKSRTAFEAVRRVFPASRLIVPTATARALTALERAGLPPARSSSSATGLTSTGSRPWSPIPG